MFYEVILDSGETPNKCTIAPLAYRPDFRLFPVSRKLKFAPLQSTVLLHPEGECLTELRKTMTLANVQGIAAIDCIWRRLHPLLARVEKPLPILARLPDGILTAYPRRNKFDEDPEAGLATIEAIFAAAALLGHWDSSLLSEYYFGRRFIELNRQRFLDLGVHQAGDEALLPSYLKKPRTSLQRRRDRGRG